MPAPEQIDGASVLLWTPIDGRHRPTSKCRHFVAGILQSPTAGLAICQSIGEDSFYLIGCDEDWQSVTDTWHQTIEDAKRQAEFEYEGVGSTWQPTARERGD